jgi:hypothetical protein
MGEIKSLAGKGNFSPPTTLVRVGVTFGSALKPANLRFHAADLIAPSNPFTVLARVQVLISGVFFA